MKIKLTKDHVIGKAGDVVEVEQGRANYLIRANAAVEYAEPVAKPVAKKKAPTKKKSAPRKKKDAEG